MSHSLYKNILFTFKAGIWRETKVRFKTKRLDISLFVYFYQDFYYWHNTLFKRHRWLGNQQYNSEAMRAFIHLELTSLLCLDLLFYSTTEELFKHKYVKAKLFTTHEDAVYVTKRQYNMFFRKTSWKPLLSCTSLQNGHSFLKSPVQLKLLINYSIFCI